MSDSPETEREALDRLVGAGYRLVATIYDALAAYRERGLTVSVPGLSDFEAVLNQAEVVLHPVDSDEGRAPRCKFCGHLLGGGPGAWYSRTTDREVCDGGLSAFHEPKEEDDA